MRYHADLPAHFEDWTSGTFWPMSGADVLAEGHQLAAE
jgi:hypothetical protein